MSSSRALARLAKLTAYDGDGNKYIGADGAAHAVAAPVTIEELVLTANPLLNGVVFTGVAGNKGAVADSVHLADATNDFGHWRAVTRADYTPSVAVLLAGKFDAANFLGWKWWLLTTGYLRLEIGNGSNFSTYRYDSTAPVATPDGRLAHLCFFADRDGNLVFGEAGLQLGAGVSISGSAAQTVTNTGELVSDYDGTNSAAGIIHSATHYNLVLTATEIENTYLNGGRPLAIYKQGIGNLSVGGNSFGTSGLSGFSGTATGWAGTGSGVAELNLSIVYPARFFARATFDVTFVSGSFALRPLDNVGNSCSPDSAAISTSGSKVVNFDIGSTSLRSLQYVRFVTTSVDATVTNFRITKLGAVCHFDAADVPLGLWWNDSSGNGLTMSLSSSCVWLYPAPVGARKGFTFVSAAYTDISTSSGTTAFINLPPNCVLADTQTDISVAYDGTTKTLDAGTSGTPTKHVNAQSITSIALLNGGSASKVPESRTAFTQLYLRRNQTGGSVGTLKITGLVERVF